MSLPSGCRYVESQKQCKKILVEYNRTTSYEPRNISHTNAIMACCDTDGQAEQLVHNERVEGAMQAMDLFLTLNDVKVTTKQSIASVSP